MKTKNYVIYSDDQETLRRLKSEYDFIGRQNEIFEDRLVVFALPQKKQKQQPKGRGRGRRVS